MRAYCLNKISKVALSSLKEPDIIVEEIKDADSILVRSQSMHEMDLPENILAIARAGAGVNNIPLEKYAKNGVVVFNTPGANANAVKELVLCSLFLASRDIIGGNKWVCDNKDDESISADAEKAKSKFAGREILGKTILVIGLGVIGVMVANACDSLGMHVRGYDPFLTINNAMRLNRNVKYYENLDEAVEGVDFVTIHVALNDSTKGMINKQIFDILNDSILLNFSRDQIVNEDDLLVALNNSNIKKYVTDFANNKVVNMPNTIILPHLGASTEEAEDNCAMMAIEELKDYLENGNITHSVNYPDVHNGIKYSENRVCVLHQNIPGIIAKITNTIVEYNSNITTFVNKSKGEYAYSVFDVDGKVDKERIENLDGIIKVRII